MITFFSPIRHHSSCLTRLRVRCGRGLGRAGGRRSQDGFTLIEVVVSSLIVGIVTLGTFAGFDALGKNGADQRHHNEATVLAAQSQEALRSDPALALDELAATTGHSYTQTVQGTVYTIKQTAEFKNDSGTGGTCTTTAGHSAEASSYIRTSSAVRWSGLSKTRPSVTETSLITPPVGSALEVDVLNGGKPELPVAGVTVLAAGSETTTGEKGCVIYTAIPATTTEVEAYKLGYVTPGGAPQFVEKETSITPNVLTHVGVTLAQGSSITAKFKYSGGTSWSHPNNKGETISEAVKGDTFVAGNEGLVGSPKLMAGSTRFTFNAASEYATAPGTYEASATTPISATHYPTGDLFPFQSGWAVYAGDCSLNNPEKYGVAIEKTPKLTAGANLATSVPMSYVTLNLYKGTKVSEGFTTTSPYPVKITNVSCTTPLALTPDDSYKATYEHSNTTTAEAHLTNPFQPFGAFKLCVYNSAASRIYTATYTNSTVAGSKVNIFLGDTAGTNYSEGAEASKVEVSVATGSTC
jgi:prepilin-type N-terminal cleavage/methylation domain-containing protein